MTTSLLCSVELQATTTPRSVLGFVQQAIAAIGNDAVQGTDGPTWARATSLVDYFGQMLGEDHWRMFKGATGRLSQPDEPEAMAVLKAMLLQVAGKVSVANQGNLGYAKVVSELSGLPSTEAARVLTELATRSIIRKDPVTGNYTIAATGWGDKGEQILTAKVREVKLDPATFESRRQDLATLGFATAQVSLAWGHREDWYADQFLAERRTLTKDYLKGLMRRSFSWNVGPGMTDRGRGLVLWLIAADDGDVAWYRENLSSFLTEVVGDDAVPLVVMRPNVPNSAFIERFRRYAALKAFSNQEKGDVGQDWYRDATEQAAKHLRDALSNLGTDYAPEVPAVFKAQLTRINASSLSTVLSEIMQMAYPYAPRHWFDHYKLHQPKLVEAVGALCTKLVQSGSVASELLGEKPVARDIVTSYLQGSWQLLGTDRRPIQPTQSGSARAAWAELDKHFPVGGASSSPKAVLELLLNPPFGYDWNTAALLFVT